MADRTRVRRSREASTFLLRIIPNLRAAAGLHLVHHPKISITAYTSSSEPVPASKHLIMLSLRQISRSAIRSASRFSAQPARRNLTSFTKPNSLLRPSRISSLLPARAQFSTSGAVFQTQDGAVDGELAAKLQEELQMEQEMSPNDSLPAHLQEFLDNSGFTLQDSAGDQEVVLTKAFGQENIRVSFSIADLDAMEDPDAFNEDPALGDEEGIEDSMQQGGAQSKGATNAGRTQGGNINVVPEDQVNDDVDESVDEDFEPSFPARLNVTIEKPGDKGAIQFESTAQDGQVVIENIYYFPKKEFADAKTAETDWARRSVYTGPPYGNLDEDLQVLLERYLDERGVNTALALWVPEYIDFKEQKEYLNWLTRKFVQDGSNKLSANLLCRAEGICRRMSEEKSEPAWQSCTIMIPLPQNVLRMNPEVFELLHTGCCLYGLKLH